ncbi:MAG: aldo/keto reductase [Clostridia bacterium]|nr:aldo/keto reductase [Clostridia bacterium]
MILNETYKMNNGQRIPKVALGTWLIDDSKAANAVREAVKIGYRHIDTAQAYGNERGVGEGIRTCEVPREEIFVTSKVAAEHKSYDSATRSIDETLSKTGLDYIDMMIIHSPQPWSDVNQSQNRYFEGNREVWKALEDAVKAGKIKTIGVSNFLEEDLDNILKNYEIKPAVNQILAHISNTPFDLIDYCKRKNIVVEAYSPIGHGEILNNEKILKIAEKYGVTVPQICLKYDLQLGMVILPKTANPQHMESNAKLDFTISDEDMEFLKGLPRIEDYGKSKMFPVFGGKL